MRISTTLCTLAGIIHTTYAVPVLNYRESIRSSTIIDSSTTKTSSSSSSTPLSSSDLSLSSIVARSPISNPTWRLSEHKIKSSRPALSQRETNGRSQLGTLDAEKFMQYRGQMKWGDVADPKARPWGRRSAANTNSYQDPPRTGKTVSYDFTIERKILAPDGVNRSMIVVNGAFPGPTIEANWGDTISVTVNNQIFGPDEGTAIHWHGFLQRNASWEDGVPGITQCPIPPGESFTYTFQADLYGSSWWHAHFSAQYAAGAIGAIVIHGPDQDGVNYDADLGPVLLTDYYHKDYYSIVQDVMGTDLKKAAPKSDNNLINGKGSFNCNATAGTTGGFNTTGNGSCTPNAGLAKFNVASGKSYRLRLVNAGSEGIQKFSIDGHDLTVIAYDFVPIRPHSLQTVTLAVGQRADVIVKASSQNSSGVYWIRSTMTKCALANQPSGLAVLYYENADKTALPSADVQAPVDTTDPCANDDLTTAIPYFPIQPDLNPDKIQNIDINFGANATGSLVWTMNNSTFRTDYNSPVLHDLVSGNTSHPFPEEWNVYDFGKSKSIRIILNNLTPVAHPMHLHGHNMFVLSVTNTIEKEPKLVNMGNPTRRDVQILPPKGQIVLQIEADNPGVWPLHCHIAWHVSGGLYMNVIERSDLIKDYAIPQRHKDLCTSWNKWSSNHFVDMIDSGLRLMRERE